jgi:hypothetical protein
MWLVLAFRSDGREIRPVTFEGARAFTEADELLDRLKADPGVTEVALTRLDGSEWKHVERSRRKERGEWAAIPFIQDYPRQVDENIE